MTKSSRAKKILSEIELFLEAKKYEDARILSTFLDSDPLDRESRLRLLLINVTLEGARAYKRDIAQLAALPSLGDFEKELIEKILFLSRKPAEDHGGKDIISADCDSSPLDPSGAYRTMESHLREKTELLQKREAELLGLKETICSLEQQLSEEKKALESCNADLHALGSRVTELTAQLDTLDRARDSNEINYSHEEVRLIHEELARRAELVQAKESAIVDLQDRVAEQIRVQETQLGETKNLLAARDAELYSVEAKVRALHQENADLASEREKAERARQDAQREQAGLLQAMKSSIARMEEQMGEHIRLLERRLDEKQNLLESSRTELSELRSQLYIVNQRKAEADTAKLHAETLLLEERSRASRTFLAPDSSADHPAGEQVSGRQAISAASSAGRAPGSLWLKRLPRPSPINWKPGSFSAAALPVAAAGLLLLPIGYFWLGSARTASSPTMPIPREETFEPVDAAQKAQLAFPVSKTSANEDGLRSPISSAPRSVGTNARKTVVGDHPSVNSGEGRSKRVAGYVTRRTVALRERPRYAAKAKTEIGPGSAVSILDTQGNWLRVKSRQSGAIGYVRKEYLVYATSKRQIND